MDPVRDSSSPDVIELPDEDDQLISLREAHRRGFPHPATVRRYIHEGRIPGHRVGKKFMVRQSHLGLLLRPIETDRDPESFPAHTVQTSFEELAHVTSTLVNVWPRLDPGRREEMRKLLAV